MRAMHQDPTTEKIFNAAHNIAMQKQFDYIGKHAGWTRVYNKLTGKVELEHLPGLVGVAYQHETSREGDPHLHTHLIVPMRQARADGKLVTIDTKSLYHEAKAAGMIYQAVLRRELARYGFEWEHVGEHNGMAELAGVTKETIKAYSKRATRLRQWATEQLKVMEDSPPHASWPRPNAPRAAETGVVVVGSAQRTVAQRSTRIQTRPRRVG